MNGAQVVASTGEPAFAVDRRGKIIAWNEAAQEFFGYRRREAIGARCWELLRGEDVFANSYCGEHCPLRERALRGQPINSTKLFFHDAVGGRRLARVSLLVVPHPRRGEEELVHLIQPLTVAGEPPTPSPRTSGHRVRLSERELEVLSHLGKGSGTGEIADVLCLSPSTVRHHIQNIFQKLKVHSRLEAVVLGRRIGLI